MRLNRLRHVRCLCLFGMALSSSSLAAQQQQTTEDTTAGLLGRDIAIVNTDGFVPIGEDPLTLSGFDPDEIPTSLNELSNIETRAYDLSLTRRDSSIYRRSVLCRAVINGESWSSNALRTRSFKMNKASSINTGTPSAFASPRAIGMRAPRSASVSGSVC